MDNQENVILPDSGCFGKERLRRRNLLPWWIKTFTWIFMAFGAVLPIGIIIGLTGSRFTISLYGLETQEPLSLIGLLLMILFMLKAITSYGLWTEKRWAVDVGVFDAILGLAVCGVGMFVVPWVDFSQGVSFKFRLEPVLLIIYLLRLQKIRPLWKDLANTKLMSSDDNVNPENSR